MPRGLALGAAIGLAVGVIGTAIAGAALQSHAAQEYPTDETVAAAAEAGVSPLDLQGAANTTGLDPRTYLIAVGELIPPSPPTLGRPLPPQPAGATPAGAGAVFPASGPGFSARVRLTHYVEYGVTYGGGHPFLGSTACSWNFRLGTRFVLPDGEVFVCNDRGLLGSSGWLDLWRRPDLSARYGPYVTVRVLP